MHRADVRKGWAILPPLRVEEADHLSRTRWKAGTARAELSSYRLCEGRIPVHERERMVHRLGESASWPPSFLRGGTFPSWHEPSVQLTWLGPGRRMTMPMMVGG